MVIDLALPVLLLLGALGSSLVVWLIGTFTPFLRNKRYRLSLGIVAFALSGFMALLCVLKLLTVFFSGWASSQPAALLLGIAYAGYLLFGILGCWTVVRAAAFLDRRHTLSMLYSLVEKRKNQDAD